MGIEQSLGSAMQAVVLYHANCTDGFTAAYCFHKFMEPNYGSENVKYIPVNYGQLFEYRQCKGKDVYILDFSFPRLGLLAICDIANEVTVLDHHKTAQADLENWADQPANLTLVFDMTRSGAGIAWDYFAPDGYPRSALVNYVEDRDLWKFALEHSRPINAFINSKHRNFDNYKSMEDYIENYKYEAVAVGNALENEHARICQDIADNLSRPCYFDFAEFEGSRIEGLIANCTGHFASEVGNILAKQSSTFGATSYTDKDGNLRVSLRSIGDFDVSKLAKLYGGGGHKNAAGFVIPADASGNMAAVKFWKIPDA